ncbi:MAG: M48 family metalloprotease, partial [Pseudomonadota bacterium]
IAQFGGEMSGPVADYVEEIGKGIAVHSQLGDARESFNVTLLNSSVNNAFAVPGGYIYTTRQLVSLMENEAELAAVLGHEVGHVVARHSAQRQQRAQRNQMLGGLGAILSGVLLGDSTVGNLLTRGALQAPQFLTLAYSREQEEEADRLGIDYLSRANYDPRAMASLLERLALLNDMQARLEGRQSARPPVWASTHPEPAARVRLANAYADGKPGSRTNRDIFLSRIDGMLYGDDPKQGVIEGNRFIHPDLRMSFEAPEGFFLVNSTSAVSINGQSGQAQLTLAPYAGDLTSYVRQQFSALGEQNQQITPSQLERTTVNGLPAAYGVARVRNGNSNVDVVIYAYEFARDRAYHFAAIAPAGRAGTFNPMFQSMRRITTSEANAIVPKRIDVVTVKRGDTISGLAQRMAYSSAKEERFRVLNGLGSGSVLQAGQKVKLVVRAR